MILIFFFHILDELYSQKHNKSCKEEEIKKKKEGKSNLQHEFKSP